MQSQNSYAKNLLISIAKEINKPVQSVEPFIKV